MIYTKKQRISPPPPARVCVYICVYIRNLKNKLGASPQTPDKHRRPNAFLKGLASRKRKIMPKRLIFRGLDGKLKRTNIGGRMRFRKASAQLKIKTMPKRNVPSQLKCKKVHDKSLRQMSNKPMRKRDKINPVFCPNIGDHHI